MLDTLIKDFDDSRNGDAALLVAAWLSSIHIKCSAMTMIALRCYFGSMINQEQIV